MKKQIEEIKRVLIKTHKRVRSSQDDYMQDRYAEAIYNADYRKQIKGEWKKVYQNKIATVYECSCCKHLTFGTSDYCICGAKMKGGAE